MRFIPSFFRITARLALVALVAMTLSPASAQTTRAAADGWSAVANQNGARTLGVQDTAALLGKHVLVALQFFCSSESVANVQGAVGFDLEIAGVDQLARFHFDDFEGPDAPTRGKTLMTVTVSRRNATAQSFRVSPSGSYAREGVFVFEVSALSRLPRSPATSILKALADDAAETLQIVITDPHDAHVKLAWSVSVVGKQAAFKALLGL
jgi:hypothetical protein